MNTEVNPRKYQALVIAAALDLYRQTGIKASRAYSPKAMMTMASRLTGKTFRARDYLGASQALREFVGAQDAIQS